MNTTAPMTREYYKYPVWLDEMLKVGHKIKALPRCKADHDAQTIKRVGIMRLIKPTWLLDYGVWRECYDEGMTPEQAIREGIRE